MQDTTQPEMKENNTHKNNKEHTLIHFQQLQQQKQNVGGRNK